MTVARPIGSILDGRRHQAVIVDGEVVVDLTQLAQLVRVRRARGASEGRLHPPAMRIGTCI